MHLRTPEDWALPESAVTPEAAYRLSSRRNFLKLAGLGAVGAAVFGCRPVETEKVPPATPAPTSGPSASGLKPTAYEFITHYNNFYEFGLDKDEPAVYANQGWKPDPWSVEIAGLAGNAGKWDFEDLVKKMGSTEERIYRHRCVEAWSMVVPWDGFSLGKLVEFAQPNSDAKYLKLTSFDHAIGEQGDPFSGPYIEGLRLDEARNELAFIATGIYGKPIPNQNGAPLRLVTPWKYGFKGIKSIVRLEFVADAPVNTWQKMAPDEYGFYANVNPHVDHPRWSQASEQVIGAGVLHARQPTLMFNGYEQQVGALYQGMDLKRNF